MKQQLLNQRQSKLKDRRWLWLLIAVVSIGVHHVHSLFVEPDVSLFRNLAFAFLLVVMPFTLFIPNKRIMGILWMLVGVPIFYHAIAGHFAPMILTSIVPPATETAPGNLIGGAILCITGGLSALAHWSYDSLRTQKQDSSS